jgi:hypothetical protein
MRGEAARDRRRTRVKRYTRGADDCWKKVALRQAQGLRIRQALWKVRGWIAGLSLSSRRTSRRQGERSKAELAEGGKQKVGCGQS